jgi:hypothetical protein
MQTIMALTVQLLGAKAAVVVLVGGRGVQLIVVQGCWF